MAHIVWGILNMPHLISSISWQFFTKTSSRKDLTGLNFFNSKASVVPFCYKSGGSVEFQRNFLRFHAPGIGSRHGYLS